MEYEEPTMMTVPDFFNHVDRVRADMQARGVFTVYFEHETLTPNNIRGTWNDAPANTIPKVGDVLTLNHMGYYGCPGIWQVTKVKELASGTAYQVTVADLPEKPRRPLDDDSFFTIHRSPSAPDTVFVQATRNDGTGSRWSFRIEALGPADATLKVTLYSDAFHAFAEVPDVFLALESVDPRTVDEVADLLLKLGAHWSGDQR